ncbi:MAG: NADH-quinone oxidoreductase subunit N [Saprospiraceae bacterium]
MNELLTLTGLGLFSMIAEIFNFRKAIFPVIIIGLVGLLGLCFMDWGSYNSTITHFSMMKVDNFSIAFTGVMATTALFWFLMSKSFFEDETNMSDHFSLILFALTGAFCLTSFTNLTMLFLGIEVMSLPVYVLAGSRKKDIASNEAAFKYFLMGSFASAIFLFGTAFIFGAVGSFNLENIATYVQTNPQVSPLFLVGLLLILVAMSFKLGAAPFHFWTPDVYEGAPTIITAFMSTIVKTAAIAAFFHLFQVSFAGIEGKYTDAVWAMAALTMLVGNIIAAAQYNVKRLLAYSSIGHAGFMLIAILVMSNFAAKTVLYYTAAYSAASIAAFLVLYLVGSANNGETPIISFNGLVKRNPIMAGTMTMALLSMAGIPPLAGFFAKYFIFVNAMENGYVGLVVIAIICSLIGVYYYFKIIIAMFFGKPDNLPTYHLSNTHKFLLLLISATIIIMGLFPDMIMGII